MVVGSGANYDFIHNYNKIMVRTDYINNIFDAKLINERFNKTDSEHKAIGKQNKE